MTEETSHHVYETCGCVHDGQRLIVVCDKHAGWVHPPLGVSQLREGWAPTPPADPPVATERFVPFEENPLRQYAATGAVKDNVGKAPIDLIPSKALVAIAQVMAYGTRKYKPHNWRLGLSWGQTYSSLMRHLLAWNDGEEIDPESGLPHLAHAGCQLMFLLEYAQTGTGQDDRFVSVDSSKASLALDATR